MNIIYIRYIPRLYIVMIWIQQTNAKMFGGEYEHFSNIKILLFKHFSIVSK